MNTIEQRLDKLERKLARANRRNFWLLAVVGLSLAGLLPGCATIVNQPYQMVAFSSDPEGATVAVDSVTMGTTPCVLPVPRKGWDKIITFKKPGYKTVNYHLKNQGSGALWGNILAPVIGSVVDALSGRGGKYQDSLKILLEPGTGAVEMRAGDDEGLSKVEADAGKAAVETEPAAVDWQPDPRIGPEDKEPNQPASQQGDSK